MNITTLRSENRKWTIHDMYNYKLTITHLFCEQIHIQPQLVVSSQKLSLLLVLQVSCHPFLKTDWVIKRAGSVGELEMQHQLQKSHKIAQRAGSGNVNFDLIKLERCWGMLFVLWWCLASLPWSCSCFSQICSDQHHPPFLKWIAAYENLPEMISLFSSL